MDAILTAVSERQGRRVRERVRSVRRGGIEGRKKEKGEMDRGIEDGGEQVEEEAEDGK